MRYMKPGIIRQKPYKPHPKRFKYDFTGQKIGHLEVLERLNDPRSVTYWKVKCDCNNIVEVQQDRLIEAPPKLSCRKCMQCSIKTGRPASFINRLSTYRSGAAKRKLNWDLSEDQVWELMNTNCFYCGIEPTTISKPGTKNPRSPIFKYSGIDRVDSSKGYEIPNVVSCCKNCNMAKWDLPQTEFLAWVDRIYRYQHFSLPTTA